MVRCPRCGVNTKIQPKTCRCGYHFVSDSTATSGESDPAAIVVGVLILLAMGVGLYSCMTPSAEEEKAELAKFEQKMAEIEADRRQGLHCLSGWDGSNASLVSQVEAGLRDPNSFHHVETKIASVEVETGKHRAIMQFRARNGFGGVNVGYATGLVDPVSCKATQVVVEG